MSDLLQLAALPSNHPSDAITNALGAVAVCAFVGIALYIGYQMLRDAAPRKRAVAVPMMNPLPSQPKKEEKPAKPEPVDDKEKAIDRFRALYQKIVDNGRDKLEQIADAAQVAFEKTADGYATNSIGHEGENHAVRSKKFLLVCERQWGSFRADMAYASYLDVQEHLKHILANHRMLNETKRADDEQVELSPEVLRSQELVALMRVVSRDRVKYLQDQMLKAIGAYRNEYLDSLSVWINEQIGLLKTEMRPKKGKAVQLSETDYYDKYKHLKTRLEMVARLTEWITENTQQMNEASLALSQVIHVGTVLRIIANLPEWFEDLGLAIPDEVAKGVA